MTARDDSPMTGSAPARVHFPIFQVRVLRLPQSRHAFLLLRYLVDELIKKEQVSGSGQPEETAFHSPHEEGAGEGTALRKKKKTGEDDAGQAACVKYTTALRRGRARQ